MNYSIPRTMPGPGDYSEFPATDHPNDPRNCFDEMAAYRHFADEADNMFAGSNDRFEVSCFQDILQALTFDEKSTAELMALIDQRKGSEAMGFLIEYSIEQLMENA